jgi:hypothetical protein
MASPHFMQPEGSLQTSQEFSMCFCPEPEQSSPHHPIPHLNHLKHSDNFTIQEILHRKALQFVRRMSLCSILC